MHTATRLAVPVIERVRALESLALDLVYGLYAPPNDDTCGRSASTSCSGRSSEAGLVGLVSEPKSAVAPDRSRDRTADVRPGWLPPTLRTLPRLQFIAPDRTGLPALDRYASLQLPTVTRRVAGYTEATRGCKHRCRHCPIVPVYDGQFRVVQADAVLGDIRNQVAAGAQHITFGDPDFFNGPTHAAAHRRGVSRASAPASATT